MPITRSSIGYLRVSPFTLEHILHPISTETVGANICSMARGKEALSIKWESNSSQQKLAREGFSAGLLLSGNW